MKRPVQLIKRFIFINLAAVLVLVPGSIPMAALAEDCVTAPAPAGINTPTGADAATYTYNSCDYFENEHYTWNPTTYVTTPKVAPEYNYNSTTGMCDALIWHWSPARNAWYQATLSVTDPPAGVPCNGKPAPPPPADHTTTAPSTQTPTTPTGTGSGVDTTGNNDQSVTATTNSTLTNNIGSNSTTGNAVLLGNVSLPGTTGGATSGDALAMASVMNLLQSTTNLGPNVATFVANVNGDVQGDLIIDPGTLQPTVSTSSLTNNLAVTAQNNGSITNNIDLAAQSGDATVSKNVNAGDATTGSAQAIANVVNMMNSLVAANQSFMGVININGNLNGNILMPQSFLDSLIASNAPQTTLTVPTDAINNLSAQVTNNTNITNNVSSTADSGAALADKNTNTGAPSSASTGTATTKVTIFNLANNQISAGNTMLVFVNVLGKWVGVIMDAPAGATAAALGGGVNSLTTNNTANYDVTNNGTITNNIDVSAKSGNATLSKNVNAGNAKSGNAATAVNIANLTNTSVNLTGWFGILFINVFGSWVGNFGVLKPVSQPPSADGGKVFAGVGGAASIMPKMFAFVPHHHNSTGSGSSGVSSSSSGRFDASSTPVSVVRTAATTGVLGQHTTKPNTQDPAAFQTKLVAGLLVLSGLIIFGFSGLQAVRRRP